MNNSNGEPPHNFSPYPFRSDSSFSGNLSATLLHPFPSLSHLLRDQQHLYDKVPTNKITQRHATTIQEIFDKIAVCFKQRMDPCVSVYIQFIRVFLFNLDKFVTLDRNIWHNNK